jgi:hypothetical protein
MDSYPPALAPDQGAHELGKAPFAEWWPRVQDAFPNVPESVAHYWLYEHWGHLPYGRLRSREYAFTLEQWMPADLWGVRSGWCKFDAQNKECAEHGAHLATLVQRPYEYATAIYMIAHGDFPAPIIVLDNRDGHLRDDPAAHWEVYPAAHVLIEGHRRFNLALYLGREKRLNASVSVWVMRRQ